MKPLIVLLSIFAICLAITLFANGKAGIDLSGRIAMAVMLLFTAIGHFKFRRGMVMMMPSFIPAKDQVVIATGILEILAAAGLLLPSTVHLTGILLILFFVLILPANIYAAIKKVDLEKATYTGNGINYLWFRIPEQLLFIFWVYWFAVK